MIKSIHNLEAEILVTTVLVIGFFIFVIILALTIFTINKGYAFKHTIDERPSVNEEKTHRHKG